MEGRPITHEYRIIDQYLGKTVFKTHNEHEALAILQSKQRIGKIGELKGKPVLKLKRIDLEKQRESSIRSRNRNAFRKEMFGV